MRHVDIVFDRMPSGALDAHFIEVEDDEGRSIRFGEWIQRGPRRAVLRIRPEDVAILATEEVP